MSEHDTVDLCAPGVLMRQVQNEIRALGTKFDLFSRGRDRDLAIFATRDDVRDIVDVLAGRWPSSISESAAPSCKSPSTWKATGSCWRKYSAGCRPDERADAAHTSEGRSRGRTFGSLTKTQPVRANVKGFAPARIPRVSNVWFAD